MQELGSSHAQVEQKLSKMLSMERSKQEKVKSTMKVCISKSAFLGWFERNEFFSFILKEIPIVFQKKKRKKKRKKRKLFCEYFLYIYSILGNASANRRAKTKKSTLVSF